MSKQLQDAIDLIKDPNRWTTGALARDADGECVDANNIRAVRWSASGAMVKKRVSMSIRLRVVAYCRVVLLYPNGLYYINDGPYGHTRVLEVMRAVKRGWKQWPTK